MVRFLQIILFPVSVCYGFIMQVRNLLFDLRILRSRSFGIPVISVGNLSYGGTGKTPHIEYLIRLLQDHKKIATLSRGYRRKSKGFLLASKETDVATIGDEAMQVHQKFENVTVAVDEKRARGVQLILEQKPETGVILMDDAYQHRYVTPGLSILLTDYHRLYCDDLVLPSGTLREFRSGAHRADIIIVTKTPRIFSPITRRRILEEMKPLARQKVFFSYIRYSDPVEAFSDQGLSYPAKVINILLFTGIANDYPLREHLERMCSELVVLKYADHHRYTLADLEVIVKKFNDLPTQKKVLITTEKDLMRLKRPEISPILKNLPLFCVPMEVDFHGTDKQQFDNEIHKYVDKDQRDR